ncbi:substrate-binding periplasmic protein [Roseovarius aestuarii]|uniref:Bacterial extracellular solute-binding proteins, family 3 n=1 Tax=Roseovarius aestuarii TaxID=475083 RepID=A0A1X7BVK5_9RHOB|nr:transporter substrate-binding domain-containing protein [Roseovarius aestuarii]SMC13289.1 Bacterial extracellular solute-binding proteins, family 3 [Roseovarius aestuarii]
MRIITVATLAFLALTAGVGAKPTTIRIATGEYRPFTGQDLPGHGLVNTHVRSVAKAAGFDVEFHYMPWKRALEATRRGIFDVSSYWYYSAEREDDFIYVGPIQMDTIVFMVRDDFPTEDWNALTDLSGLRIGVVPGYTYTQEFWDLGDSGVLDLFEAPSDEANLKKLLAGRIDVFPVNSGVGQHTLENALSPDEQAQLRTLETPLSTTPGYVLVSRSAPGGVSLAAALQRVVDSDEFQLTN